MAGQDGDPAGLAGKGRKPATVFKCDRHAPNWRDQGMSATQPPGARPAGKGRKPATVFKYDRRAELAGPGHVRHPNTGREGSRITGRNSTRYRRRTLRLIRSLSNGAGYIFGMHVGEGHVQIWDLKIRMPRFLFIFERAHAGVFPVGSDLSRRRIATQISCDKKDASQYSISQFEAQPTASLAFHVVAQVHTGRGLKPSRSGKIDLVLSVQRVNSVFACPKCLLLRRDLGLDFIVSDRNPRSRDSSVNRLAACKECYSAECHAPSQESQQFMMPGHRCFFVPPLRQLS
jgi:hypothetical protein